MRSIKQIKNLRGKTVLVRVDFNVPIKNGKVEDDFRIKKAIPSIKFLIKKGAKVILITHLGKDGRENLEPIIKCFFKISKCTKSQVSFFDNIRKFNGETENSLSFTKKLSTLGDIYVNEAFSVSHRMHASVVGLPKFLPSYAGFQFEEEVKNLSHTLKKVKHPFLFILGGAKFSTKMPVIQKYLKLADYVFIGGALANDLLKAKGYEIGKSLVDDTDFNFRKILQNKKLILPEDVLVRNDTFPARAGFVSLKKVNEVKKDEVILDIGNETVKNLAQLIKKSKLVLWNGPLGKYESGGEEATKKILKLVARAKTESIIGGGDIVSIVSKLKMEKKFTFVSTGGGATLDFLINGTLPGIKALK
ncbi:MAG: phosphoglycerate kinase [Candidatus Paceibacterota bacterium]